MEQTPSTPQPAKSAPTTVRASAPLCFVVDEDIATRTFVSSILSKLGVRTEQFDVPAEMIGRSAEIRPDLIFLDMTLGGRAAVALIQTLADAKIACPMQIMTGLNPILIEEMRRSGERIGLKMLPVLSKPFREGDVKKVANDLGLNSTTSRDSAVPLRDIIRNNWLDVWYQPKIDLKTQVMNGAEAFARAIHPELGVLTPDSFLATVGESELLDLTPRILARVIRDWRALSIMGIPVHFSVNIPVVVFKQMAMFRIFEAGQANPRSWKGITLEIAESEIIENIALARSVKARLTPLGVRLSIDDFGSNYGELKRQKDLPFDEIKIDRSYISNCDQNPINAGLCETIVEFAKRHRMTCVAEGIETNGELQTLQKLGCDYGQGYLFSRPLPVSEFSALLAGKVKDNRPQPG